MQTIKVGDKVKCFDFSDKVTGYIGTVLAVNVESCPNHNAPNGIYQFDCPRYAVQIEHAFDYKIKPESYPTLNAGKITYPPMNETKTTWGETINNVERV